MSTRIARVKIDGRIARVRVPVDMTEEEIHEQLQNMPIPQAPEPSYGDLSTKDKIVGGIEAAATMASGAIAEPLAGLRGIGAALIPGGQTGAEAVASTREALTYQPREESGLLALRGIGETLQPVVEVIEGVETAAGEKGYELAGPVGGAIGRALPTAVTEMAALGTGRLLGGARRTAKAVPDEVTGSVLDAGKQFHVPVMTSDVKPPQGYAGRFVQSMSEKLGPLGSGTARVSQQKAREAAVRGFAESMDIDIDTPFAADIVNSLNKQVSKEIADAGRIRTSAVNKLDEFGPVPLKRTEAAVRKQVAKQKRLGEKGDPALIESMQNDLKAAQGGDFSLVKDIRTEVIDDLKAIRRSDDARSAASKQAIKSAMDEDLKLFAQQHDRQAAADWIKSNRAFADAYTRAKDTELKRIIKSGEATPEKIMPLLRGGKASELQRLHKTLGPKGQEAARKAIIQDALKDSKFFEVDANPNPDAFATALNRANRQQAIKVFFSGQGKKELDGLTRLLNATRRAQQGSAVVKTGEQMIAPGAAALASVGLYADPVFTGGVIGVTAGLLKAYESRPFRGLLVKLSNTPKGSRVEKQLLDSASTFVVSGWQAAREEQEQER